MAEISKTKSEWAEELKQAKQTERAQKAGKAAEMSDAKAAATAGQAGKFVQAGGKAVETAGKGIKTAGRGAQRAEKGMKQISRVMKQQPGQGTGGIGEGMKGLGLPGQPRRSDGDNADLLRQIKKQAKGFSPAGQAAEALQSFRASPGMAVNAATKRFLMMSWKALITSWGLTILYINFHFIVKYIAGSLRFCQFGEEWAGGASAGGGVAAMSAEGASTGGKSKMSPKFLEIGEIALLFLIDAIIAAIILSIIMFLFLLFWIVLNPCEALQFLGEGITEMLGPIIGPIARVFVTGGGETACQTISWITKFLNQ